MIRPFKVLGLTFLLAATSPCVNSFVFRPGFRKCNGEKQHKRALLATGVHHHSSDSKATLTFRGDYRTSSETIPLDQRDELVRFFRTTRCRDLLISVGGSKKIFPVERNATLDELWRQVCLEEEQLHLLPEPGDELVAAETSISFPGMRLESTVCCGIKLRESGDGTTPEYRLILIGQKQVAKGFPPSVWLFNKLTGNAEKPKDVFLAPDAWSSSTVSVLTKEDGCAIDFDAKMKIEVIFPSVLLRILPTNKEKMEEVGSISILKTVSKDIDGAVQGTMNVFKVEMNLSAQK